MNVYMSLKWFLFNFFQKNTQLDKFHFDHYSINCEYFLHKSVFHNHMSNILNINFKNPNDITINHYNMNFADLCEKYKFEHFWDYVTNPINTFSFIRCLNKQQINIKFKANLFSNSGQLIINKKTFQDQILSGYKRNMQTLASGYYYMQMISTRLSQAFKFLKY